MLQLSVHIFSVRAVEGTGPYRFVEYVTRATCGSAVNENQLLASDTLLDDDNIVPDELFMLGRQYGGDDLTAEVIKDPPENLFGEISITTRCSTSEISVQSDSR